MQPIAQLAGVYKKIGAGGTVPRPTKLGPAMMFNEVEGYPGWRVLVGLMASRERVGLLLDCAAARADPAHGPTRWRTRSPRWTWARRRRPCQEVVHRADDPDFDLRTAAPGPDEHPHRRRAVLLPGPAARQRPGGGHRRHHPPACACRAATSCRSSSRRAGTSTLSGPRRRRWARGSRSRSTWGWTPRSSSPPPSRRRTRPTDFDELTVAGAIRGRGVELAQCLTVDQRCIAGAEVVIEGEILPERPRRRGPELAHRLRDAGVPRLRRAGAPALPVLKITAITTRGTRSCRRWSGRARSTPTLAGIPTEASIYNLCQKAMPGSSARSTPTARAAASSCGHAVQQEEGVRRRPRPLRGAAWRWPRTRS